MVERSFLQLFKPLLPSSLHKLRILPQLGQLDVLVASDERLRHRNAFTLQRERQEFLPIWAVDGHMRFRGYPHSQVSLSCPGQKGPARRVSADIETPPRFHPDGAARRPEGTHLRFLLGFDVLDVDGLDLNRETAVLVAVGESDIGHFAVPERRGVVDTVPGFQQPGEVPVQIEQADAVAKGVLSDHEVSAVQDGQGVGAVKIARALPLLPEGLDQGALGIEFENDVLPVRGRKNGPVGSDGDIREGVVELGVPVRALSESGGVLEDGMVFTIEPAVYDGFGVRLEDTVFLDKKARFITDAPRSLDFAVI